jgi:hypothetical protein
LTIKILMLQQQQQKILKILIKLGHHGNKVIHTHNTMTQVL